MNALVPDLGLRYIEAGHHDSSFSFRRIAFDQVSRAGPELYSICVSLELGPKQSCAASFDLDAGALAQLLAALPSRLGAALSSEITRPTPGPVTVDIPRVVVDITARLGERQHGAGELFVPFVVESVGPASETAAIEVSAPG